MKPPAPARAGAESLGLRRSALRHRRPGWGALIVSAVAIAACRTPHAIPPTPPVTPEANGESAFDAEHHARLERLRENVDAPVAPEFSSGLLVRLAFEEVADLDLFVTDPARESVYFANSPTRSGGRLVDDRGCGDPGPRVEIVHFPHPIPGRYRVGVDFHRRCPEDEAADGAGVPGEGLYRVRIDEGGRAIERAGMLTPGLFEVIVVEFDVGAADGTE